jgi:flavin reductase (DIM6/NTAB) family NADH-FMN oxidoreductase RutF
MSSFWAPGWTLMLGLQDETKTAEKLARDPECVINLASTEMWRQLEKRAPLTGKNPVPEIKATQFRFEKDRFGTAGLTPIAIEAVKPLRAVERPIQVEARVHWLHSQSEEKLAILGGGIAAEVEILRLYASEEFKNSSTAIRFVSHVRGEAQGLTKCAHA